MLASDTQMDIMDAWMVYGITGETNKYKDSSSRLNDFLIEEIIKEFGVEEAKRECLVNDEDINRYMETHKSV